MAESVTSFTINWEGKPFTICAGQLWESQSGVIGLTQIEAGALTVLVRSKDPNTGSYRYDRWPAAPNGFIDARRIA
jgi:hypothetical protein